MTEFFRDLLPKFFKHNNFYNFMRQLNIYAKAPGEKCGWSFKKKSTKHRVLNICVTSENLSLGPKETSQSTTIENQTTADTAISKKVLGLQQLVLCPVLSMQQLSIRRLLLSIRR